MPTATAAQRRRAQQLAAELAGLGFMLPGTVTRRYTRCGTLGCRCQANPPHLHGPYLSWTRKVAGTTVTRRLSPAQLAAYAPWFAAARRFRQLRADLEALACTVADADLRSDARSPGRPNGRSRKTPAT